MSALYAGIPYALGADEPVIIDHAVLMLKNGDLRPPFFDYPGLVFYLQLPVLGLRFVAGTMTGEWSSLDAAGASHFYLWARIWTALIGVGTVYLVYRIGLRWGRRQALVAAALLAVMPTHVRESRLVLTDVPMTFFVTLALLLTLRAHERRSVYAFAWAGAAVGLGTAVKYTAGVALLLPLLAALLAIGLPASRVRSAAVAVAGFVLAFVIGAPYTILDLPGFIDGLRHLAGQYMPRDPSQDHAAWIYLKHLLINFHWPAFLLAVLGLITSVVQLAIGRPRLPPALVVLFPLIFVLALGNYSPIFARYVLPVVPFACLSAAIAIVTTGSLLGRFLAPRAKPVTEFALALLMLLLPALHSLGYVRAASVESTQAVAYRWFVENVPPGSIVVVVNNALRFPSDLYRSVFVRRASDKSIVEYRELGAQYLVEIPAAPVDFSATDQEAAAGDGPQDAGDGVVFVPSSSRNPGPDLRITRIVPAG